MNHPQQQQQQLEKRLQELKNEEAMVKQQMAVQKYAGNYEIQLQWPAVVQGNNRTATDLLQHRLLEAGLLYDMPIATADVVAVASQFIANLEASDCFHSINVEIGGSTTDQQQQQHQGDVPVRNILITVQEKKWYRLHAGAGLKTEGWLGTGAATVTTDSFMPAAEIEMSAGLRNIAGCLDRTDVQYAVDTHNIGTYTVSHVRPLYTVLPTTLSDYLLEQSTGSQYMFAARAALDTADHITVSSYQQFQRWFSIKAATAEKPNALYRPWYGSLEWSGVYRDLVPRRHATLPFQLAASKEICAQAGATVKHGITGVLQYDSTETAADIHDNSGIPVTGVQMQCSAELATPPGDVGFVKGQAAVAGHLPIGSRIMALHVSLHAGYLHHTLNFGGLCNAPTVSDRFLLGGTGSFRGFVPAGIGPRSTNNNNKVGDALGGTFFYMATAMASLAPPTTLQSLTMLTSHVRLFGFCTAGTCLAKLTSVSDVVYSTRASAGFGVATQAMGPRLEATYAWPLRYGPLDGRRRFQFGMSFSI